MKPPTPYFGGKMTIGPAIADLQPYRCDWCYGYHLTSERGQVTL